MSIMWNNTLFDHNDDYNPDDQARRLEEALEKACAKIAQQDAEKAELQSKCGQLEAEKADLQNECNQKQIELTMEEMALCSKEGQLDEAYFQVDVLTEAIMFFGWQAQQSDQQVTDQRQMFEAQVGQLQDMNTELREQVASLQQKNGDMHIAAQGKVGVILDLQEVNAKLQGESAKLREEVASLQQQQQQEQQHVILKDALRLSQAADGPEPMMNMAPAAPVDPDDIPPFRVPNPKAGAVKRQFPGKPAPDLRQGLELDALALKDQVRKLEGLVVGQQEEIDLRMSENASQRAELGMMTFQRSVLLSERDNLAAERNSLTAERNNLMAEAECLEAALEGVRAERDYYAAQLRFVSDDNSQLRLVLQKLELQIQGWSEYDAAVHVGLGSWGCGYHQAAYQQAAYQQAAYQQAAGMAAGAVPVAQPKPTSSGGKRARSPAADDCLPAGKRPYGQGSACDPTRCNLLGAFGVAAGSP
jgi:hypothetical protein